ncbi:MAG: hypothetical protein IKG21_11155 [Atopobiaceae bacterium]|nr:hypothetical protein [Atopobiaceae bacterium]
MKDDKLARLYDKGFYLITGDFDANTPGKYFLTVEATDNHGNNKSKEFSITVEPAPIPEPAHETPVESTEEAIPVEVPAETEPQQPQQTYIINTNTHVYHHPSCRAVRQMKEDNKREFVGTSQEVQDMGYTPCQICYP